MKKVLLGLGMVLFLAGCGESTTERDIPMEAKPLTIEEAKNSNKTVVEVFSDMQCGHCKALDPTIQKLEKSLTGVDFRLYHFPFLGPESFPAAVAIECVALEDKEKKNEYIAEVFAAKNLSTTVLRSLAKKVGANEDVFKKCLKTKQTASTVRAHMKEANARSINSTPSIFINGEKYEGERSYEVLNAFLKTLSEK